MRVPPPARSDSRVWACPQGVMSHRGPCHWTKECVGDRALFELRRWEAEAIVESAAMSGICSA